VKKSIKLGLKEAIVAEPAVKKRPKRMIGPSQKFDLQSHTSDGIRVARPDTAFLPSPPNSGNLREVLSHDLDDHDHLGQEDAAFKKKIDENVKNLPTSDSTISPKRKKGRIIVEGADRINLDSTETNKREMRDRVGKVSQVRNIRSRW
jgi:hypothetical protein